jgi:MFS family permease
VEERSVRIAVVLASATVSGAFGGCIAYGIGYLNGSAGLEGFRWLLIIEGIITVASVALVVFFLPDWPARAKRLTDEDKKYIDDRIAVKGGGYTKRHATEKEIWETAGPCRMWGHYLAYMILFYLLYSNDSHRPWVRLN